MTRTPAEAEFEIQVLQQALKDLHAAVAGLKVGHFAIRELDAKLKQAMYNAELLLSIAPSQTTSAVVAAIHERDRDDNPDR